jgi:biopolymer transport protein ExbD
MRRSIAFVVLLASACRRDNDVVRADPAACSACPSVVASSAPSPTAVPPIPLDHFAKSEPTNVMTIAIDAKGALTLAGKPISAADLDTAAHAELAKDPDTHVVIAADTRVEYGKVIALIDHLRSDGVMKLAFATSPRDAGPP